MKILYLLIGPKGSGKTYIGTLVARETDIVFLRVEPLWLALKEGENGWEKVEVEIDGLFSRHDKVMIESLGAGSQFEQFRASLEKKYELRMVKVSTDLDTCLTRVQTRNSKDHIPVSDDKVIEYNQIAAKVELPWFAEINNNGPATEAEILELFSRLL